MANPEQIKIIIFDGICHLCTSAIHFLQKRLTDQNYRFTPSQLEFGEEYIAKYNLELIISEPIILIDNQNIFIKSDVILEILDDIPFLFNSQKMLKFIPKYIRNWFYDRISKNRYQLFGKQNSKCFSQSTF